MWESVRLKIESYKPLLQCQTMKRFSASFGFDASIQNVQSIVVDIDLRIE